MFQTAACDGLITKGSQGLKKHFRLKQLLCQQEGFCAGEGILFFLCSVGCWMGRDEESSPGRVAEMEGNKISLAVPLTQLLQAHHWAMEKAREEISFQFDAKLFPITQLCCGWGWDGVCNANKPWT